MAITNQTVIDALRNDFSLKEIIDFLNKKQESSVRDYFAAKSLQIAHSNCSSYEAVAKEAYAMADAMLAERAK